MKLTTYGVDIAKRVFQIHWVVPETGEIQRKKLKRADVMAFFRLQAPGRVVMEACGAAQHWARQWQPLGHTVQLIHPKFVRPFVMTNKNDAADAQAIWTAAQQPGMRFVLIKSEAAQAVLALHRIRSQLVKFRTMQMNQLRGLLGEFGIELPGGREAGLAALRDIDWERVPALLHAALQMQMQRLRELDEQMALIERQLAQWLRSDDTCSRVAEIPGVGLLTATAMIAAMGDAHHYRSGRAFAASLGLVPRHSGTGGHVQLGGISKRGDRYLRTLLMHGARSVILHQGKDKASPWLRDLLARRPFNVAVAALANKMARTIWALVAHQRRYESGYGIVA
ncbi:IS110 family transposase [Chromobacterium violaceum]|uniref:Transposase IS116/IS110/IS902 family n=3 Tax=Chromobacterium violaceum TaxID=536 RepID=A0AAX2MAT1_CHRVL|nr:IS110 family transposase [Chromobacterium violaceum]STB63679.1 Transposase IS116/IS110/IS902 family [Chromobacterium violaceum]STB64259.1 Transposase IS116/IS110/IS902 family [Chromobacterium violaceum]STB64553.1 Transposase IS116/IS110/IS902 family [Chromobacterium violaceum]STB70251.1 Transposase IS116/IS110/IS902 family [Chromobacterium violaceum]STB70808.1 Transposase IS116/IS110/IS902 family [Chromobacterium violaceum]